jgi:3-dehydroquinate dehydratase
MQIGNQCNILEHKAFVHSNGAMRDNLTSRFIPKSDVLFTDNGVKAREPSRISVHVAQVAKIYEPCVL